MGDRIVSSRPETIERYRDLGVKAAAFVDANPQAWPAEIAAHMGIAGRTLSLWTTSEEPAYEAFQEAYVPALVRQAKAALKDADIAIQMSEDNKSAGPRVSWETWKLERRLPRFFGAKAQEAVSVQINNNTQVNVGADRDQVVADLRAEAAVNPELREALKGVLGGSE